MKVGVAKETAPGERRVALVPEQLGKLKAAGLDILVEQGAGAGSSIPDAAYADAGATIVSTVDLYGESDAILRVQKPTASEISVMKSGQAVLGLLQPLIDPQTAKALAEHGVTAISLDAIPRTLSRAQTMDALSSQANVGGYKAVLIAANAYGRYFPLLTTAAGTAKPANVLILGIGVAGLAGDRHGPAPRRGRQGLRRPARDARAGREPRRAVRQAQDDHRRDRRRRLRPRADAPRSAPPSRPSSTRSSAGWTSIITTAQVPGRKPPLLVTAEAVGLMKSGSVIVDMAASALGGNVELSKAGETIESPNGVTIIAPDNLPASMPAGASAFYARNISALLLGMVKDGALNLDFEDEVTKSTVISHGGAILSEPVKKLLEPAAPAAGGPA